MQVGQREDVPVLLGHLGHRVVDRVSLQRGHQAEPSAMHDGVLGCVRREQLSRLRVPAGATPRVDGEAPRAADDPRSQRAGFPRGLLAFWRLEVSGCAHGLKRLHRLWKSRLL